MKITEIGYHFKRNYMKMNRFLKFLILIAILASSCKKKSEPTPKDLLTAHVWIGVNLNYTVASIAFSDAQIINTDTTAIEFKKDNTIVFYTRDVNTGTLTERNRQTYTLSPDNKTIEISSTDGLLTPEIQASLLTAGIKIPTSINVEKITTNELILKGSLQQTITLPPTPPLNISIPVTIKADYTWTYRK
ncbi:MAG: hypothetical protein MUC49_06385 [Raineya sp.]|jgi:hypothetical protein|nr:hypothetical protein [Raineya sp.]